MRASLQGGASWARLLARVSTAMWIVAVATLTTGCVTRVIDNDGTHPALWKLEPTVLVKSRMHRDGRSIFGRFLRAGGRVECSGWLFKKQTTHIYARMTSGRSGRNLSNPVLSLQSVYLDGLFKGVMMNNSVKRKARVETYETVSMGFNPGYECSCVYVTATAPVYTGRTLVVTGKVCPDEE